MDWAGHVALIGGEVECMQNFGGNARRKETTITIEMLVEG
jgi:hypothetical protein